MNKKAYAKTEKDERYQYFLKYATVRRAENDGELIFVEVILIIITRFPKFQENLLFTENRVQELKHLIGYI